MLKHYLKIAVRNIKRAKGFSFINIFGLALGIACSLVIILFVQYEKSYDQYHKKSDQTYRVAVNAKIGDTEIKQTYTPAVLSPTLLNEHPEVTHSVRFAPDNNAVLVKSDDIIHSEQNVTAADPGIFDIFSMTFIEGNPETALNKPNTTVITETAAKKYFNKIDPLGRILNIDGKDYHITGIIKDIPVNTHFHFDFFLSLSTFKKSKNVSWFKNNMLTYIVLREDCSQEDFELRLSEIVKKYIYKNKEEEWTKTGDCWQYYLQPLKDIHLTSHLVGEFEANGNASYISIFSIIAIFIILIACINYMNLSTARSINRAKEVGIRKTLGSKRPMLIQQFLAESILSSGMAFILAIIIVETCLPSLRNLIGKPLAIHYFNNPDVLPALFSFALIIGLLSGSYPAFLLSSFMPISTLKGQFQGKRKHNWLRNGLVLIQFSFSIFLFIGTVIVNSQLNLIKNKNLGFNREHVVVVKTPQPLGERRGTFKNSLLKDPHIISASASHSLPGRLFENFGFAPEGAENVITLNVCCCDYDFMNTLGLEMKEGRFFSRDFKTDTNAIIINEAAVKLLKWREALNKYFFSNRQKLNVIGVVKDYNYESLHQPVRPMALLMLSQVFNLNENHISVKIKPYDVSATLEYIKNKWNLYSPNTPFEFSFLDEDYNALYRNENLTGKIFSLFSILVIFIASLGLFGLSSFMAITRTKEIGVRKVLGASVSSVAFMLMKEYSKWTIMANFIAWPLAYLTMNGWLQNFAYRTNITIWTFLFSALLTLAIALFTVSYQSIKAACANPVKALRYE